jgi:hypothetical protein
VIYHEGLVVGVIMRALLWLSAYKLRVLQLLGRGAALCLSCAVVRCPRQPPEFIRVRGVWAPGLCVAAGQFVLQLHRTLTRGVLASTQDASRSGRFGGSREDVSIRVEASNGAGA